MYFLHELPDNIWIIPSSFHVDCGSSAGIKESDTGLAAPSQWDLVSDKQMMQEEQPLQVQYFWNFVWCVFFSS